MFRLASFMPFFCPMLSISSITCQALWDHEGVRPFFVSMKRAWERLKVASSHAFPMEAPRLWWTLHPSPLLSPLPGLFLLLSIPQTPPGLKAACIYFPCIFICSQPGCNHLTLSTCSQGLDVFLQTDFLKMYQMSED